MMALLLLLLVFAFLSVTAASLLFGGSAWLEGAWWRQVRAHVDERLLGLGLRWDGGEAWRGT